MKVLNTQTAEILVQKPGKKGIYEHIEQAARTCYQSYENAKEGTAEKMVKWLEDHQHTAMLEHATVYLMFPENEMTRLRYSGNEYSIVNVVGDMAYATTNYRVIIENDWKKDLKYLCEPTEHHTRRTTMKFITNLQVATELLRHRKMSFAMESSRYCCYDREKFGDELTFILPVWFDENTPQKQVIEWANACQDAENHYMRCRDMGWPAEQCAQFLPKSAKTTIVMTGFEKDWQHFLDLRYYEKTGKVHPQMKQLSELVYQLLNKEETV